MKEDLNHRQSGYLPTDLDQSSQPMRSHFNNMEILCFFRGVLGRCLYFVASTTVSRCSQRQGHEEHWHEHREIYSP